MNAMTYTRERASEAILSFIGQDWLPTLESSKDLPDYETRRVMDIYGSNPLAILDKTGCDREMQIKICHLPKKQALIRECPSELYEQVSAKETRAWLWNRDGLQEISENYYRAIWAETNRNDCFPYTFYTFGFVGDLHHLYFTRGIPGLKMQSRNYRIVTGEDGYLTLEDIRLENDSSLQ